MKWVIREYMTKRHISSFSELSRMTGIEYHTMMKHIEHVELFRVFEIVALDNVLKFADGDLLKILREARV